MEDCWQSGPSARRKILSYLRTNSGPSAWRKILFTSPVEDRPFRAASAVGMNRALAPAIPAAGKQRDGKIFEQRSDRKRSRIGPNHLSREFVSQLCDCEWQFDARTVPDFIPEWSMTLFAEKLRAQPRDCHDDHVFVLLSCECHDMGSFLASYSERQIVPILE